MRFNKSHKTLDEQISLLMERGLIVENFGRAKHYLGHLNYYRLSAYWFPFTDIKTSEQFIPGTTFEDIIELYVFDRELRLLLLDAIERIEVSVRSKWSYILCKKYGAHAHLNSSLFKNFNAHENSIQILENEVSKSKEAFILHLVGKYEERLPTLWSLVEIMTFGQLSYWFAMLKYRSDKNAVAHIYDMDEKNFASILHHLTILRNKCAHHNRVWNCEFTITPKLPNKRPLMVVQSFNKSKSRKIYNTLVILVHLLNIVSPDNQWKIRLLNLINKHQIDVCKMGFPENFNELSIWK